VSEFVFPINIFSRDIPQNFREFKNKHYKDMIKTILCEDNSVFERFIDNLIKELCADEDFNIDILTGIDKLYIMLIQRAQCVSTEITFTSETVDEEKAKVQIPVSMADIIETLGGYEIQYTYEITDGHMIVNGTLPKGLYYDDVYDVAADTLSTITFNSTVTVLTKLDLEKKRGVLSTLPSFVLPEILRYIQKQDDIVKEKPIISINTQKKLPFNTKFDMHLYNGTIPEIIKMLYNTPLKEFYNNEYILMRRFKFSYDTIANCTPLELAMYYDIIHSDIEREKSEHDQQSRGGSLDPSPGTLAPE
jgi:hypothetical protein